MWWCLSDCSRAEGREEKEDEAGCPDGWVLLPRLAPWAALPLGPVPLPGYPWVCQLPDPCDEAPAPIPLPMLLPLPGRWYTDPGRGGSCVYDPEPDDGG